MRKGQDRRDRGNILRLIEVIRAAREHRALICIEAHHNGHIRNLPCSKEYAWVIDDLDAIDGGRPLEESGGELVVTLEHL